MKKLGLIEWWFVYIRYCVVVYIFSVGMFKVLWNFIFCVGLNNNCIFFLFKDNLIIFENWFFKIKYFYINKIYVEIDILMVWCYYLIIEGFYSRFICILG